MINKAVIIGASTVGKTTLLNQIKKLIQIPVLESDDMLTAMNGGTYPKDYEYKLHVLAPKMVKSVLQQKATIFFSNVDYFTSETLTLARQKGFTIIQLIAARKQMEKRNKQRIEKEGYADLSEHFDRMELYQKDIYEKNLVDKVIDTNKPAEEVVQELITYLDKN